VSGSYTHVLEREQRLALPIETVFAFYGQARNLEELTPPWMGFHVITPEPIEMRQGTLIDYRLSLRGVPLRWRTRIELWDPPTRFIDLQLRGPYSLWEHLHTFRADGDGATVIGDRVRYRLPLGPLGQFAHALLVRRDLERVFDYREQVVAERIEQSAVGV
jgi:ligand-binding SRPBCC domain-containing protein